jgi:hypothetical protein
MTMWTPDDVRAEAQRIRDAAVTPTQPLNYPLVDTVALLTRVAELLAYGTDVSRMQQLEARVAELERRNAALREVVAAAAQDGSVAYMASVVERAGALLQQEQAAPEAPAQDTVPPDC